MRTVASVGQAGPLKDFKAQEDEGPCGGRGQRTLEGLVNDV